LNQEFKYKKNEPFKQIEELLIIEMKQHLKIEEVKATPLLKNTRKTFFRIANPGLF